MHLNANTSLQEILKEEGAEHIQPFYKHTPKFPVSSRERPTSLKPLFIGCIGKKQVSNTPFHIGPDPFTVLQGGNWRTKFVFY